MPNGRTLSRSEAFGKHRAGSATREALRHDREDAARYGRVNYALDQEAFHIVEVRVPTSFVESLYSGIADSMRYVSVDPEQLMAQFNRLARVNIWDNAPWVAKP